jgi:hypothetical protein
MDEEIGVPVAGLYAIRNRFQIMFIVDFHSG